DEGPKPAASFPSYTYPETPETPAGQPRLPDTDVPVVKSVVTVETPADGGQKSAKDSAPSPQKPQRPQSPPRDSTPTPSSVLDPKTWDQVMQAARQQLEPEGAVTGATRELQAGLGAFLQACHEHGVKVGPWRLQHVVGEFTFGDHPTSGAISVGHWACKAVQPWHARVGLFRG